MAQLAGIMAAKQTPQLIPLCHIVPLSHVSVEFSLSDVAGVVEARATVACVGSTGVEMEALSAVTVALLTVYDMTKSVSHEHVISDVRLEEKEGGVSGHFHRN